MSIFCISAYGFSKIGRMGCNFGQKILNKVSACFFDITYYFWKSFQKPSSGSLFRLSSSRLWLLKLFRKLPVILKRVPKASYDIYTGENWPRTAKESWNWKYDAAFRTIFRVSNCFQRSKQRLNNYFSILLGSLKIFKLSAHIQKVLICFNKPSKIFIWWPSPTVVSSAPKFVNV